MNVDHGPAPRLSSRPLRRAAIIILIGTLGLAGSIQTSGAQTFEVLTQFGHAEGREPFGALTLASDGYLYGTTQTGGMNHGTIFRVDPTRGLTTLHLFTGANGSGPQALMQASDGLLYGVTRAGGSSGRGTVFRFNPANHSFATLVHFTGSNGASPMGGLAEGLDGLLYGTASAGGSSNYGTLFRVSRTGSFAVLRSFRGSDGRMPYSGLVRGSDGRIYGTTFYGGSSNRGLVFAVGANGAFSIVAQFTSAHGANPWGALTSARDGHLYGTTYNGGSGGAGTVFRLTTAGALTTVRSFSSSGGGPAFPRGGVIQGADGGFYGTSAFGGSSSRGTVYRVEASGALSVLRSLSQTDGANPSSSLVQHPSGDFWGVLPSFGPTGAAGTVFSISRSGAFRLAHAFRGTPSGPRGALFQARDGRVYGTSHAGGGGGLGTVFAATTAGRLDVLGAFSNAVGAMPVAGVVQGSDGHFYGTTTRGGSSGVGAVYRITSAGQITQLRSLTSSTGHSASARLVQASDGSFLGTALQGGSSNAGTIFRVTSSGAFSVLRSFNCADGRFPHSGLVQGLDGRFYGTTVNGGAAERGTIYAVTPSGSVSTLYSLTRTDGANPYGELALAPDGQLYGATFTGGSNNAGTVFRFNPGTGRFTTLRALGGSLGSYPEAGLVLGRDGALYGLTTRGGASGHGTIFRLDPATGAVSVVHSFRGSDGSNPRATLVQAADGHLYGVTSAGGAGNTGVVFRLRFR